MEADSPSTKIPSTPKEVLYEVEDAKDQLAAMRTILHSKECSIDAIDMAKYLREEEKWSAEQVIELLQYLGNNAEIYRTMIVAGYSSDESRNIITERAIGQIKADDIKEEVRGTLSSILDDVDKKIESEQK